MWRRGEFYHNDSKCEYLLLLGLGTLEAFRKGHLGTCKPWWTT